MYRPHLAVLIAAGLAGCTTAPADVAPSRATSDRIVAPQGTVTPIVATAPAVLRETVDVTIGAAPERWALVWRRPPTPSCGANDFVSALTCPCDGFAYGEQGELDLIRRQPGRADERFALTPLFAHADSPAWETGLAVLRHWPVEQRDYEFLGAGDLPQQTIEARPASPVMVLGDYDHDGRATEFLLEVGTLPCEHMEAVLVGVSRAHPSLHAFGSAAHPDKPLILEPRLWDVLLKPTANATSVEWACGDHGSETQTEVTLQAGPNGIEATRNEYACDARGEKGVLQRSERL